MEGHSAVSILARNEGLCAYAVHLLAKCPPQWCAIRRELIFEGLSIFGNSPDVGCNSLFEGKPDGLRLFLRTQRHVIIERYSKFHSTMMRGCSADVKLPPERTDAPQKHSVGSQAFISGTSTAESCPAPE